MTKEYKNWLQGLKQRIRSSQIKAAVKVNTELIELYWSLGYEITQKEKEAQWGDKLIAQLSKDLLQEFPDMKGFSPTNLKYIRRWFQFYKDQIGQQAVAQLGFQPISDQIAHHYLGEIGQQVVDN